MKAPRFLRKNRKQLTTTALIVGVLVVAVSFYVLGWRFDGFGIVRGQVVTITDLPPNAVVYLNNIRLGEAGGEIKTLRVTPGTHTIIVEAGNRWPWQEEIVVSKESGVTVRAFLTSIAVSGDVLSEGTDEYREAQEVLRTNSLPTKINPLTHADSSFVIFLRENTIVAASVDSRPLPAHWCAEAPCTEAVIFEPIQTIRSLAFYPHRPDHLLIGYSTSIVALEIDPKNPRTFQPILEGSSPQFAESKDGTIYGRDLATIFRLNF